MKTIKRLLGIGLLFASTNVFSQGLEGVIVEKYYLPNAADVTNASDNGAVTPLTTNSVVYRVYVDMAAGYKFNSLFGSSAHNLTVNSTANFYNDPSYGVSVNPGTVSFSNIRKNTAMIDSWFTTGGAGGGKVGVLKSEDTDGSIGHATGLLANNPGGCFGLAITGTGSADGMLPSSGTTYIVPNGLGLGSALDVLDQTAGSSILITNGSIAALGGVVGPTSSNKVLIAQFTTEGQLSFALNLQIQNIATGVAENYVSSNPVSGELTHPSLTLSPNVAPTIAITSPSNNAAIITGTAMTFTANAADANGTVTGVSFYLDGVLLSTDATSPYTASYTAVTGSHSLYAVVSDNDCASVTSSTVNFTVAPNQAPSVVLTAPTSAIAGTSVTFSATASDVDGSVAQVEFFVNNVSVGIDATAPYSVSYTATLGSGQVVKAVATDDLGLTANSNLVTMNVLANVPPTVSLTAPLSGAAYVAPTAITIAANASDSDGTVAQVEFFVNNVSVGIDATSPYSVSWTSTPGSKTFVAKATDSNGALTTSSSVTLDIADPNALPYEVGDVTQTCELPTFCLPLAVSATNPINNVKGFDVTFTYDANELQPTGNITVYNTLTNSSWVETASAVNTPGILDVAVYFNGSAPANAEFEGTGNIFCIEFTRLGNLNPVDSSALSVTFLQESYITGVQTRSASAGKAYSVRDESYPATLEFWSNNSPILYNAASPNTYLVTNIYGVSNGVITNQNSPVVPNTSGVFVHDLTDGTNIQISRDVNNNNSVQLLVNAADAVLGKTLLINGAFTPNVYQIIALDVNLDGVVSAGDVSQLRQRATLALGEFMQAWNYSVDGVSNGQASKDWIFVDQSRINSNPAYTISASFPSWDGVGFNKAHVPVVPFVLAANVTDYANCPLINDEIYKGIMLGDVNGSYAAYTADGILKTNETDYILVDLTNQVIEGSQVRIPVSFVSSESVNAIDMAMTFEPTVEYSNLNELQSNAEGEKFFNSNDETFRYSSFNVYNFDSNENVAELVLTTNGNTVIEKDLNAVLGMLNGKVTEIRFKKATVETSTEVQVYPNPSTGIFAVTAGFDGWLEVIDVTGKLVHQTTLVKANQMSEINLSNVNAGIYMVRCYNNDVVSTVRVVIEK